MAYDEKLADRIRGALRGRPGVTDKEMFGGVAFLQGGRMFVGVVKDELMVRVGKERHREAVARPHARTMDFTGRPMEGYVFVAPAGFASAAALAGWVDRAWDHVATLPARPQTRPKKSRPKKKTRAR